MIQVFMPEVKDNDAYDFILLTVRENQLYEALAELKNNKSNIIVTMVNSLDSYKKWEDIVGKGRILPAFPGAGGSINNDGILDAALTPRMIQPTTFAEISDCPERAGKDWKIMKKTAKKLKRNFSFLRKQAGRLSPCKMNIFRFLPLPIMPIMLAVTFESSFGDKFMYQHARKAPDEMRELHKQFYAYMKKLKEARYEIL